MDKSILFMGIGKRDLEPISEDPGGKICGEIMKEIDGSLEIGAEQILLGDVGGDRPKNEARLLGYRFPMLAKTMAYFRAQDVKNIDRLYLLATKRTHLVPLLEQASQLPGLDEDLKSYARKLLELAKKDNTHQTAALIKKLLDNNPDFFGIHIGQVELLNLGTYGYFDPLDAQLRKGVIDEATLRRADINILDFFEFELRRGLVADFCLMENADIYLSTFAGGLPQMQRALDIVLQNMLGYAKYHRIFVSENRLFITANEPIQGFLEKVGHMSDLVLRLDWSNAERTYQTIERDFPDYLPKKSKKRLKEVFSDVRDHKAGKMDKWFDRFSTLIFNSLYNLDANSLVVWLKCLEETALKILLFRHEQTLGYKVVSFDGQKINFVRVGDNDHDPHLDKLVGSIAKDLLEKYFFEYRTLFLDLDLKRSRDWLDMNRLRNNLIHNATPVEAVSSAFSSILRFLKIDDDDLDQAINALRDKNLEFLATFESKCLQNGFFIHLANIAGLKCDYEYHLFERTMGHYYFEALHLR